MQKQPSHPYLALLFLDFDGVIHPTGASLQNLGSNAPIFCQTVEPFLPKVGIVISSSWRTHSHISDLQRFFTPTVAQHIFDVTPQYKLHPCEITQAVREKEIVQWLQSAHSMDTPWLAIDDMPTLFSRGAPVLYTKARTGFSDANAYDLSVWLAANT